MRTSYHIAMQRRQVTVYLLECLGALFIAMFLAIAPALDERDAEHATAIQREVIFAALDQAAGQMDAVGRK